MKKMKVLAIAIFVLCAALLAMTGASADQGQVQPGIYTPDYDITEGIPVWRPTEFKVHANTANKVICFGIWEAVPTADPKADPTADFSKEPIWEDEAGLDENNEASFMFTPGNERDYGGDNLTYNYIARAWLKDDPNRDSICGNDLLFRTWMKSETLTLSENLLVFSNTVNPPRDGSYRVDVNYVEGLDFLCAELYLKDDLDEQDMVVDSHWTDPTKDSAGTTRLEIPLTICQPASTYIVKVYALKYGYPKYYFTTTNSIVVLTGTDSGSIIFGQLKKNYKTFEELEATIYYPNDNNLNNLWMEIGYSSEDDGYIKLDEIRKDINGNNLYWQPLPKERLAFGSPGKYTLIATIYQKIDGDDIPVEVTRDSREITVTATRGKLVYDPQLPPYIPADNSTTNPFTFYIPRLDGTDGADFYYIRVESLDDNGADGQHLIAKFDETDDCGPEGHKVTVQGVSDCVRVHIEAGGKGLAEYYWKEINIPVMNVSVTSRVSIWTDDAWMPTAEGPVTVPIHTDIPIYVSAPDAEWVRLYDMEGEYDFRNNHTEDIEAEAHVGNIGNNFFYATACFRDNNGEATTESAFFTIKGTSTGIAGPYSENEKPTLAKTDLTRGETTTVTYPKCMNANHYWLEMDRWNEADSMWDFVWDAQTGDLYDSNGGTAMVATIALDPGTYRVRACAEGIGYDRYEVVVTRELKISDKEIPQNGILVTVNQETVDTMEEFAVSAYAPKANRLEIYWDYENSKDYKSESWKNTATWTNEYDSSGTYQIVVRAWYTKYDEDGKPVIKTDDDGNTYEEEYYKDSSKVPVTVNANQGVLSFGNDLDIPATVPETKQADTVNLFTVAIQNIPEHADGVYAVVQFEGDDQPIYNDGIDIADNKPLNVSFNAKLDAGRVLRVDLTAYGSGYNAAHISKKVTVVPAVPETYEAEILFKDHPNDATIEVYPNEQIDLIVCSKNENKQIKAIRLFDGNMLNWDQGPNEQGDFDPGTNMSEPGTYTLYAMVTFEALPENFDWDNDEDSRVWVPTNLLTVNVLPDAIGSFDFVEGSPNTVSVKRGEDVTFTFTAAAAATKYSVDAWEDKPNGESYNIKTTYDETTVTLNTLQLPVGEYIIRGRAGTDGMGSRQSESEVKLIVTENPEVDGQIYLEVEKTTATTYEEINASVCAPGAESVEIIRRDSDNIMDEREFAWGKDTDIATGVFSWSKTGTIEVFARAYYENDLKPKESACVPVTITASLGKIWLDTKEIPTSAKPGEALPLAMSKPDAAKYMDWGLYYDWDGDWSKKADQEGNGALNFEIPADEVINGNTIMLSVNVGGIDYEENHQTYLIPVVNTSDKVTIAVSKNNEQTTTVQVEEKFTVTIHAPGAEYVQFYDGNKFRSRWVDGRDSDQFTLNENGDCFFTDESFSQAEDQTIYAIAKIDNEFYTSEPVRVSVTSNGTVGSFTTSTANTTITRGDDAVFTFTAVEHASKYWVDVYSENEQGGWNQQFNLDESTEGLTCTLHTANLSPGQYRVLGQARGVGYEQKKSTNEIMITIVNPSQNTITVSNAEPMVNENITVSIFKEGASKLNFTRDNEDPNENEMELIGEYWTGDFISFYSAGIHTLTAYYWEEGQWIAFSTINVNVQSNGVYPFRVTGIPSVATTGQPLTLEVSKGEADYMYWELFYDRDDNNQNQQPSLQGNDSFNVTIEGSNVVANKTIELRISVGKAGYENNNQNFRIQVINASTLTNVLRLRINNSDTWTLEPVETQTLGEVNAQVTVPNGYTKLRLYDGDKYCLQIDNNNLSDTWTWTTEEGGFTKDRTGTYEIFAQLYNDEKNTWVTTNTVTLTVTAEADLVFDMSGIPTTIFAGSAASFTLKKPANADEMSYSIREEVENDGYYDSANALDDELITIPSANVIAGHRYELFCRAWGAGYNATEGHLWITAVEAPTVTMSVNKSTVKYGEAVTFVVNAPGASSYVIEEADNKVDTTGNSWTGNTWTTNQLGSFTFKAKATFPGKTDPVESDGVGLTVNPLGDAIAPTITIPKTATEKQQFTITVGGLADNTTYSVKVKKGEDELLSGTGKTEAESFYVTPNVAGEYQATITYNQPGREEKTVSQTITVDHAYCEPDNVNAIWSWAEDYSSCSVTLPCTENDGGSKVVQAKITSEVTTEPTHTVEGKEKYTATIVLNGTTYSNINPNLKNLGTISHKWSAPQWVWNETASTATAQFSCDGCDTTENKPAVIEELTDKATEATCTASATKTYEASVVFNGTTYTDEKTITVGNPRPHDMNGWQIVWGIVTADSATATAEKQCKNCDHKKVYDDTSNPITKTKKWTTQASCKQMGQYSWTATVTIDGNEVTGTSNYPFYTEKTGHTKGAATTEESGCSRTSIIRCTVCNEVLETTALPDEHKWDAGVITKEPTCSAEGVKTYTCENNRLHTMTEPVEINPDNHQWKETTYTWSDHYLTITATRVCSLNETHIQEQAATYIDHTAPLCETAGSITFTDPFTNTDVTKEIEKKGHGVLTEQTIVVDDNHSITYWECSDCQKLFESNDVSKPTTEQNLFASAKAILEQKIEALGKDSDSAACKKLISDAKAAIEMIGYDNSKALGDNIDVIKDATAQVLTALPGILETQRAADAQLIADKAAFTEDKTEQKAAADKLATTGDSAACQQLIQTAKTAIDALTYDESKSLTDNKAAITAIMTKLGTDLATQRAADKAAAEKAAAEKAAAEKAAAEKAAAEKAAAEKAAAEKAAAEKAAAEKAAAEKAAAEKAAAEKAEAEKAAAEKAAAEKAEADKTAAGTVTTYFRSLSSASSKASVAETRAMYNALTEDQKQLIAGEDLAKLENAEKAVEVTEAISGLTDTSTKTDVEAARAKYDALSDGQKQYVSADTVTALTNVEKAVEEAANKPVTGAFNDATGSYTITENKTAIYEKPAKAASKITVPDTVEVPTVGGGTVAVPVTEIKEKAFSSAKKKLTQLTIGNNVEIIGKSACEKCEKLTTIKGGAAVKEIRDKAFASCTKLKKLPTFNNLVKIGKNAFAKAKALTKFVFGEFVSNIGSKAFYECEKLKTLTFKGTCKLSVASKAFDKIASNAKATIKKAVKKDYTKALKKGKLKESQIKAK